MIAKTTTCVCGAPTRAQQIAALNDAFRRSFDGGRTVVTAGITALGPAALATIIQKVRAFDRFEEGNDPFGEHDFGSIKQSGTVIFWKIDYYDSDLRGSSPDPADPAVTTRVLTIMRGDEY
jgi:hypothetical protein